MDVETDRACMQFNWLAAEPLRLRAPADRGRILLRRALITGWLDVACPCAIVEELIIRQEDCYDLILQECESGELVPVSLPALLEGSIQRVDRPIARNANSRSDAQRLAFVRPGLLRSAHLDPQVLTRHRRIRDFKELTRIPEYFAAPGYQYVVGPPLGDQPGMEVLEKVVLRRGFQILYLIGLIDSGMLKSSWAHSSVLMLIRRALGCAEFGPIIDYLVDPVSFVVSALVNSYDLDPLSTQARQASELLTTVIKDATSLPSDTRQENPENPLRSPQEGYGRPRFPRGIAAIAFAALRSVAVGSARTDLADAIHALEAAFRDLPCDTTWIATLQPHRGSLASERLQFRPHLAATAGAN